MARAELNLSLSGDLFKLNLYFSEDYSLQEKPGGSLNIESSVFFALGLVHLEGFFVVALCINFYASPAGQGVNLNLFMGGDFVEEDFPRGLAQAVHLLIEAGYQVRRHGLSQH